MRYNKLNELYQRLDFVTFLKIVLVEVVQKLLFPEMKYFFSQEGEDVKILYLLQKYNSGFYIEVGSNHPIRDSNTFKLYLMGWSGILVDGNKQLINKAKVTRKKDVCIHALVSDSVRKVKFYIAENWGRSSINLQFAKFGSVSDCIPETFEMETVTLNSLIEQYKPNGKNVDVLSIDVEGHDYEVLQSIDLNKHEPTLIVIEDLDHWIKPIEENKFYRYLQQYNYDLISKDRFNLYFMKSIVLPIGTE